MRTALPIIALLVAAACALPGGPGCGQAGGGESADGIALPPPELKGKVSVEETLARRRSVRRFQDRALTQAQIGQLAWAAQGITEPARGLRTAPSAGALYPLKLYLLTAEGVFRYSPVGHRLVTLAKGDMRQQLSAAALGQRSVASAALAFVITGEHQRMRAKYGERAQLYVHLEAGHVAQNIHLQAVALGLGSVPVGAFREAEVSRVLGLAEEETPLYIIPVGYPAS